MNVAILRGRLSSAPRSSQLASGDRVVALEVTVPADAGPADTVPVAWFNAPDAALAWVPGQEVVVVGRVRRRFFRTGGATASRTEVLASSVIAGERKAAARKAIEAAGAVVKVGAVP